MCPDVLHTTVANCGKLAVAVHVHVKRQVSRECAASQAAPGAPRAAAAVAAAAAAAAAAAVPAGAAAAVPACRCPAAARQGGHPDLWHIVQTIWPLATIRPAMARQTTMQSEDSSTVVNTYHQGAVPFRWAGRLGTKPSHGSCAIRAVMASPQRCCAHPAALNRSAASGGATTPIYRTPLQPGHARLPTGNTVAA